MNPLRRLVSENGLSVSPAQTRTQEARRRARFLPLGEALEARRVLSTFRVNTLLDTVAVNLKTGKDASGHISLRSAIEAANSRPNSDTILLPKGTIKLTIMGANEDNAATGDLDIKGNVTIKGKRASSTIIDGNSLDRVFQVLSGRVQISGLTIQHGQAEEGGGLFNSGGQVTLTSVVVVDNLAMGNAGAAGAPGTGGTGGPGPGGEFIAGAGGPGGYGTEARGGGIFNQAGSLSLFNSTIQQNFAQGGDGGQGGNGAIADIRDGQSGTGGAGGAGGPGGTAGGGGVFNAAGASMSISGTTFLLNAAVGGNGGLGGMGSATGDNVVDANPVAGGVGGNGIGGSGGEGGSSGPGEGGGLFNLGAVSLSGKTTTFGSNEAIGGYGGNGNAGGEGAGGAGGKGASGIAAGNGGSGAGGAGGSGGAGLDAEGGGVLNTGTFISTAAIVISGNDAVGGRGGDGGAAGPGYGGSGGLGSTGSAGGEGGEGEGNKGGSAGIGGRASGGGLNNFSGGIVSITAPKNSRSPAASLFTLNDVGAGPGGNGGGGGAAIGGAGGDSSGAGSKGGSGESGYGSSAGKAGAAGNDVGGGLTNAGTVSFTGITVNFTHNRAFGTLGGYGGGGGAANGGDGGNGASGGDGGDAYAGDGADAGESGNGSGGGIANFAGATLTIEPRLDAKKRSQQSKATNLISANEADGGTGNLGSDAGVPQAGAGGSPSGAAGHTHPGSAGVTAQNGTGAGGGLDLVAGGIVLIDDTTVTGNTATTSDNNVFGTFMT
jgi:hypothetical protein